MMQAVTQTRLLNILERRKYADISEEAFVLKVINAPSNTVKNMQTIHLHANVDNSVVFCTKTDATSSILG